MRRFLQAKVGRGLSAITLVIAANLLSNANVAAAEAPAFTVGVLGDDAYAPFSRRILGLAANETIKPEILSATGESRHVEGYAWNLVREAWRQAGYTVVVQVSAWTAARNAADLGAKRERLGIETRASDFTVHLRFGEDSDLAKFNVDTGKNLTSVTQALFPVERDAAAAQKSEPKYLYSREPLFVSRIVAYLPMGAAGRGISPENLRGYTVGFLRDCGYADLRAQYPEAKIMDFTDEEAGVRLLRNGRIAVLFGYEPVFDYVLAKYHLAAAFIKKPLDIYVPEYLCIRTSAPNAARLIADFDRGFAKIPLAAKKEWARQWHVPILNTAGEKPQ